MEVNSGINKFVYKFLYEFEKEEKVPLNNTLFNSLNRNGNNNQDGKRTAIENSDANNDENWIFEELLIEYLIRICEILESNFKERLNEPLISLLDKCLKSSFWKNKIEKEVKYY